VLPETDDKRVLFLVPWQSRAVFGTIDTGSGDLDPAGKASVSVQGAWLGDEQRGAGSENED